MSLKRTFFAPWANQRITVDVLERHCALCRVLELPYDTGPADVIKTLRAAPTEVQDAATGEVEAALARIPEMFDWTPPDYTPDVDPIRVLASDSKAYDHYALFGGRGSTKSYTAAKAIVRLASTQRERVAGAREFMKRIKESSKELLDTLVQQSPWAADWNITEFELKNNRTGSEIIFIGLTGNNAKSVGKSLEAVTLLWADEAQLLTARSIDIILPTVRAEGSRCLWTWNPGEDPSAVDNLFRYEVPPERALVGCKLVEDNPYLYRTRLAAEMRSAHRRGDTGKFRHIWRGAHLEQSDATVFTNVQHGYFSFDQLPCGGTSVKDLGGMDFGYGGDDPSAAVRVFLILPSALRGYTPECGWRPVLYIAKEAVQRAVPNHELWKLAAATGARELLCDSAMPLMVDAVDAAGKVAARGAPKGPGSLMAGIRKIQSCDVVISPDCPATAEEFKNVRWSVDPKTGKVRKPLVMVGEDHTIAAIRYALSETELTELQNSGVTYV